MTTSGRPSPTARAGCPPDPPPTPAPVFSRCSSAPRRRGPATAGRGPLQVVQRRVAGLVGRHDQPDRPRPAQERGGRQEHGFSSAGQVEPATRVNRPGRPAPPERPQLGGHPVHRVRPPADRRQAAPFDAAQTWSKRASPVTRIRSAERPAARTAGVRRAHRAHPSSRRYVPPESSGPASSGDPTPPTVRRSPAEATLPPRRLPGHHGPDLGPDERDRGRPQRGQRPADGAAGVPGEVAPHVGPHARQDPLRRGREVREGDLEIRPAPGAPR
jgi:hypothetical protein